MADVNYDEFTNTLVYSSSPGSDHHHLVGLGCGGGGGGMVGHVIDPMFRCYSEHFPERLSRLHLCSSAVPEFLSPMTRRPARRARDRYKTQPITFDEITEVDEETTAAAAAAAAATAAAAAAASAGMSADSESQQNVSGGLIETNKSNVFKTQKSSTGGGACGGFSRSMDGLVLGFSGSGGILRPRPPRKSPPSVPSNATVTADPRVTPVAETHQGLSSPAASFGEPGTESELGAEEGEEGGEGSPSRTQDAGASETVTSSTSRSGFTAAEIARRRRKYSKRSLRRRGTNEMAEEEAIPGEGEAGAPVAAAGEAESVITRAENVGILPNAAAGDGV